MVGAEMEDDMKCFICGGDMVEMHHCRYRCSRCGFTTSCDEGREIR